MKRVFILIVISLIAILSFVSAGYRYNPMFTDENGFWTSAVASYNGYYHMETDECWTTPTSMSGGVGVTTCCLNGIMQQVDCENTQNYLGPYSLEYGPFCGNMVCQLGEDGCNCPADCSEQCTATVPEFGLIAGITTLLGALGIFLFIRRTK